MENIKTLYLRSWRGLAIAVSLALIAYLLYFHKLGNLLPGYSTPELATISGVHSLREIMHNPIYAPYTLIAWLLTAKLHGGILMTRVVAASFAVLMGLLFFAAVRSWCTYRTAFLATILFITSAGLLHFARIGTGNILQFGVLALLDMALWYKLRKNYRILIAYLMVVVSVLLLYVPGMIWFEVVGVIGLFGVIMNQLRHSKKLHLAGMACLALLFVTPLIIACVKNPQLLRVTAGLPPQLSSLAHAPTKFLNTMLAIFIRSNDTPLLWVGHAPLLNAIEAALVLLGAYYVYSQHPKRRLFMFGTLAVGLVLVALGGSVTIACLVPILYLFVAIGLDGLLGRWLNVFPRNPVARLTGVGLVCIMLTFSVLYQVRTYFVAWPHAPATRQIFSKPAPQSVTIETR